MNHRRQLWAFRIFEAIEECGGSELDDEEFKDIQHAIMNVAAALHAAGTNATGKDTRELTLLLVKTANDWKTQFTERTK